jgi:hypothetical protein
MRHNGQVRHEEKGTLYKYYKKNLEDSVDAQIINTINPSTRETLSYWAKRGMCFGLGLEEWNASDYLSLGIVLEQYQNKVTNGEMKLGLGGNKKLYFVKESITGNAGRFIQEGKGKDNAVLTIMGVPSLSVGNDVIFFTNRASHTKYYIAHELGHAFDCNYVNQSFLFASQEWKDWQLISGWQEKPAGSGNWVCSEDEAAGDGAPSDYALDEAPLGDFAESFLFYLFDNNVEMRSGNPRSGVKGLDPAGPRFRYLADKFNE